MQAEDTPRQRMRIGLPADWVSPRGEEIQPKVDAFNPDYRPGGGDKTIFHEKLEIQTGSKINSLQNQDYQPGGGDKPIFSEKLAFQKEAKPKVGSLENADYRPGGGDKKFVHSERLQWTDKPALNTRENIDYRSRPSNVRILSEQLDFSERAQPKVGSLDNTGYEPRPSGVRVYHERLPWLEHGSNRPRLRRSSGEHYPGGSYESRREFAEEIDERAKRQDGGGTRRQQQQQQQSQKPRRASSEEAAQRAALRERQREFAQRTAAEAAAKPAATRQRRLPNERDPKQPDQAAEAAAAERKRRQKQLQEEKVRREQRQREQQIELQKQKEQQQQQQQQLQQQKQLEQQRQRERQQQQQQKQPGNNSQAAQRTSGAEPGGQPKSGAAAVDGKAGQDGMAKQKPKAAATGQKAAKQQQQQQQQQQQTPSQQKQNGKPQQQTQQAQREPDEWEYARHEFDRPKQAQKKKNQKSGNKASAEEEASSAVPPLSLPAEAEPQPDEAGATSRGAKDLYKTEGYAKRFELAPTSVTNRSLILAPLENYRHDWHEDAEVKVRMDADGRLVLKSNRKVPTRLPRVAEADPPAPATYVSSISKKERPLYDPKPKLVTGEDLGHLLPRLENLLETPGAPKKHYSQYSVDKRPGKQPGYGETMQRQRESGYHVNPEGERVALISSDDYNNQFYSEVRVRDAQLEPRTTGQYARHFEQQQQQQQQQAPEPQPDELSDRLMLQPSDQLPHYRPDGVFSQPPPAGVTSSLLLDYGEDEEGDAATGTNSSQAGGRAQRRPRQFVNWKPGEVLYATGERPAAGGPAGDAAAAAAYSEKLRRQRQQQQQQQQGKAVGAGFSGLHEQRKNWYRNYNQRMLAREGNVEKVSERDLLQTTYELY